MATTKSAQETKFGYEYAIQRLTDDVKELREMQKKQAETTAKIGSVVGVFVAMFSDLSEGEPAAEAALKQINDLLK